MTPFNWDACVSALSDNDLADMAESRSYSLPFCQWLKAKKLVGLYEDHVVFPVSDAGGKVTKCHCRFDSGSWGYLPKEPKSEITPLVIGNPQQTAKVWVFESQWDAFAVMDKTDWHTTSSDSVAVVITRGASNGKLIGGLCKLGSTLYAFKQNDQEKAGKRAGDEWLRGVCEHAEGSVLEVSTPAEHKDANDWTRAGATREEILQAISQARLVSKPQAGRRLLEFFSPSQLRSYTPPEGHVLVGDCHITCGEVAAIGGAPGIGKSRALTWLAYCGATKSDWFGLPVHRKFRTMILQNENGRLRMAQDFRALPDETLDQYIRICPPPPCGMAFNRPEFVETLKAEIEAFKPDVIGFDPWNSVAKDDGQRDYLEAFDKLRSALPEATALVFVAHTRKPKETDWANKGRGLINLFSGSHVLVSIPRSAFVLQAATEDPQDNRVVWTCCKNNNGEMGERSAWLRQQGVFSHCQEFDWDEFDNEGGKRNGITKDHLSALFKGGARILPKGEAFKLLKQQSGFGKTACYAALDTKKGKFKDLLIESDGQLSWKQAA